MVHPVRRIIGQLASERGRSAEQRVVATCKLASRPAWMRKARRGTHAEDHEGIDVVVETDVGKLFIQVKSSERGKAAFLERRRSARVSVVIVDVADTPEQLLAKIVSELSPIRDELLAQRTDDRLPRPVRRIARTIDDQDPRRLPQPTDAEWTLLRDYLLAVLLSGKRLALRDDDELGAAIERRKKSHEVTLPAVGVDEIVQRFPALFRRTQPEGLLEPAITLEEAYRLELTETLAVPARDLVRAVLVAFSEALRTVKPAKKDQAYDEAALLAAVAAKAKRAASREDTKRVWELLVRVGLLARLPKNSKRLRISGTLSEPAKAEAKLDEGIGKAMGPYRPIDGSLLRAVLGSTEPWVATAPAAAPVAPKARSPASLAELGDWLLAVLLATTTPLDDEALRAAMDQRARAREAVLPRLPAAEIVAAFPARFERREDGTASSKVTLAKAYKLRLGRLTGIPDQGALRNVAAALEPAVRAAPITDGWAVVEEVPEPADVTQEQLRSVLGFLSKIGAVKGKRMKPWLGDAALAEVRVEEALRAALTPFEPIDPAVFAAVTGR